MSELPQAPNDWTPGEAAHLLNRAGFGGSPQEVRRLHKLGRRKAVESLLKPDETLDAFPLPEWAEPEAARASARERVDRLRELRQETKDLPAAEAEEKRRAAVRVFRNKQRQLGRQSQGWWFDRMLRSKAPLREKMTLFWHDHFATSIQKVRQPVLMLVQNQRFRRHATGSFRELTHEMLEDPAMMLYLDTPTSKKGKPNENFAREVMELFTLGVGHYTEQDIREAARAFTGYSLNRATGRVFHNKRQWDPGSKTVLGESGSFDGHAVVDVLFRQRAAARHLPAKLWQFFVGDPPPEETLAILARSFRKHGFRVEPLLRQLFLSREFYSEASLRSQIKCPVQFLVQMLKELEIDDLPPGYALVAQAQLGQVLFLPPNVAGWDWGKAWINTNTLLSRYNIAGVVTKGSADRPDSAGKESTRMAAPRQLPGALARLIARNYRGPDYEKIAPRPLRENPRQLVDTLVTRFFHGPLPAAARDKFRQYAAAKKGAVFTNREVAELCHLMLSTPYYQLA